MCRLLLMTIACMAILFGIVGILMMPKVVQQKIEQRIQLKIGTKTFDRFTRIPIPLTVKFYFFNVTNSDEVLAGLERPKFNEIGPFMFNQWRRREIVDLLDHNRKVTYKEVKTYYPMYPQELINSTSFVYYDLINKKILKTYPHENDLETSNIISKEKEIIENSNSTTTTTTTTIIKMLNPYAHNITIVNMPLLSVLTKLAGLGEGSIKRSLASKIASRLIENGRDKILITRQANKFLFDGYRVGLMDALDDLVSNTLGYNFESPLPQNKFGFFFNKNGTWSRREAGEMTIYTGRNNSMDHFMLVDNWNGLKQLNVWPQTQEAGNRCNEIRGTDGSQFHPGVTRQQVLSIFSPMICTSIYVKYKEDTSVRDIPLLRFTTPPDVFGAPKKNAQNSCYCTVRHEHMDSANNNQQQQHNQMNHFNTMHQTSSSKQQSQSSKARITNARCYLDGLMDLSLCQRGAPIAASAPHFYNSDPMLAMAAGLEPSKDKHETYLDIEPMTGAVMRAASRAQLSAFVEKAALDVVDSKLIGHMTSMVAPLLWLEESAEIDEKSSREFKNQLLNLVQKANKSFFYAIIVGLIIVITVTIQCWYVTWYKIGSVSAKKQANFVENDDDGYADGESLETPTKRKARKRKEQEVKQTRGPIVNSRRLTGARKANLQASRQPLILDSDEKGSIKASSDANQQQQHASGGNRSRARITAAAAVGVAAALGAADAAATASNRRTRAAEKRRPARRADYEQDGDDETLSRRALVASEWPAPGKGGQTSGGTSSTPSIVGGNGGEVNRDEPSTGAGSSEMSDRGGGIEPETE